MFFIVDVTIWYLMRKKLYFLLLFTLIVGCSTKNPSPFLTPGPTVDPAKLTSNSTIEPLTYGLDDQQLVAQEIILNDVDFQEVVKDPATGAALRTEIFGIYPVRESDITEESTVCNQTTCYRVDVYNYGRNASFSAMVDVDNRQIVDVDALFNVQPELPPHLTQRALEIATTAPEVSEALGFDPAPDDPTMPNVKTALNNTACERSRHLCVAPTFIVDDRALWAIVDLTDEQLVGIRWTEVGQLDNIPTQRNIQREDIFEQFCQKTTHLSQGGWDFDYMLTSSDGLRLSDVQFEGKPVLRSVKLVDWHVSYSTREGFGYSDAVGCPMFSSAAVVALDAPVIEEIEQDGQRVGFAISQDYLHPEWPNVCNYRYQERYEFYRDGRFRLAGANYGRGCGNDGTYRPVQRIDFAVPAQTIAEWDGANWADLENELWQLQGSDTLFTSEGYQYRLMDSQGGGYYVEPNRGQFAEAGRGDNAYVYVTRHNPDEGDADLLTIGPCCNNDYQQGPEKFINNPPESIIGQDLTLWYVPQIENEDTPGQEYCWADRVVVDGGYENRAWPCFFGPMFVPVGK